MRLKQRIKGPIERDFDSFGLGNYLGQCEGPGSSHLYWDFSIKMEAHLLLVVVM